MVPAAVLNHPVERERLLNDLLKSSKQCLTRFGGRTELATELDPNVSVLCSNLEIALSHGLKKKLDDKKTSPLRQVSELVLGGGEEYYSLWDAVKYVLTQHEKDRYENLKHIWTDRGRARAWLRSSLNERSLERYLNAVLMSQAVHMFYENWAFIHDIEVTNVLPDIASGLNSILFAISIDRPEMNHQSGGVNLAGASSIKNERIIEEPSPKPVKRRNGKKGQKIISFGDDDDDEQEKQILNGEISNSVNDIDITVTSPPPMERSKEDTIYVGVECAEEAAGALGDTEPSSDTETIGDSENVDSSCLRPVNNSGIGELIPVSLSEETHSSEDSISVPSFSEENESSAVKANSSTKVNLESIGDDAFKELERLQKNLEELNDENNTLKSQLAVSSEQYLEKLKFADTKVQELNRENELLKHQLRKYVTAVQMLKEESVTEGNSMYEQKLVQVAEMHGELMELNDKLQRHIAAKEAVIRRLYLELEALRGPLGPSEIDINAQIISLWLPSVFLTGPPKPHHVYQVHLRIADDEWNVFRRYTQFYTLHKLTKKQHPVVSAFQFPPKKTIGYKDTKFVEERRLKLQQYLRRLLNHIVANNPALSTCPSKDLLISIVPFFGEINDPAFHTSPRPRIPHPNSPQYAGL